MLSALNSGGTNLSLNGDLKKMKFQFLFLENTWNDQLFFCFPHMSKSSMNKIGKHKLIRIYFKYTKNKKIIYSHKMSLFWIKTMLLYSARHLLSNYVHIINHRKTALILCNLLVDHMEQKYCFPFFSSCEQAK